MSFWNKLIRNKMALIGMALVFIFIITAMLAPVISDFDPAQQNLRKTLSKPDDVNILGTDELGRDIFSRIISGTRTSLIIGVVVVLIGGIIGITIGAIAGFYGGWLDNIVMRFIDALMAFPTILLALFLVTILGTGLKSAMIAVGLASIPRFARLIRSSVLSIKEKEFVEAARALGQSNLNILLKHILPNCIAPILVQATLSVGNSILTVASLGFLGLGANPGDPEWGAMLSDARAYLTSSPHVATFPGIAIALTVLGFNLLGDGLRDVMDVRQN